MKVPPLLPALLIKCDGCRILEDFCDDEGFLFSAKLRTIIAAQFSVIIKFFNRKRGSMVIQPVSNHPNPCVFESFLNKFVISRAPTRLHRPTSKLQCSDAANTKF